MVSRYSQTQDWQSLQPHFSLTGEPQEITPQYNISPWQTVSVVRQSDAGPELAKLRWGLIPYWAKEDQAAQYGLINARAESVANGLAFKRAYGDQRCLVVADGLYRWKSTPSGERQPHRITLADGGPFAFAGLWDSWSDGEKPVETCTIIVTTANKLLRRFGKLMPVIVDPGDYEGWLSGDGGEELLKPCPDDWLRAERVSTEVNKATNDTPACIEPVRKRHG